jgi:exonuclease VII large subunit
MDPTAVLSRGYSIAYNARGEVLRDAAAASKGELVTITLARGWLAGEVKDKSG